MTSTSQEGLLGMVKGLADVVKSSHDAQKTQQEEIRALADSMKYLATSAAKTISFDYRQSICKSLKEHVPQDKLERFLENFVGI